jgi:hypothetical protein
MRSHWLARHIGCPRAERPGFGHNDAGADAEASIAACWYQSPGVVMFFEAGALGI